MNKFFLVLSLLIILTGCNSDSSKKVSASIIPQPANIELASEIYQLETDVFIAMEGGDEGTRKLVAQLSQFLVEQLSVVIHVNEEPKSTSYSAITLKLENRQEEITKEAYSLFINENGINIVASSNHGLFNGLQSLKQLLFTQQDNRQLPYVEVRDQPVFEYRGMMLDVSRHFFTVDEVKRFIDLMALYKLNKFHWHLTDDQGWRIEIKQYPLLTEIGSYRAESQLEKNYEPFIGDGIAHSGFYTQEQIKEVVAYAAERYIDIIPEIEMPGHAMAALAAYPELGCFPINYQVSTSWWESFGVMCPHETTFNVIEDILDEVIELFPSNYLHIGGDEVAINTWQQSEIAQQVIQENDLENEHALQGYFFDRVSQYLVSKERQAIGWDEILEKSVQSQPTVMIWRDLHLLKLAEEQQTPVILTPGKYTYFDYYQGDEETEPLAQCCFLSAEKVYGMPVDFSAEYNVDVVGGQGQLWTAFIKTESHLQYMAMPRMPALAEALWSESAQKNFLQFKGKMKAHEVYLENQKVNFKPIH